jgi:hypothetical protein
VKRLEVRLTRRPGDERVVGQLAETRARAAGGQVVFEYDPAFLRDPLWLERFPGPWVVEKDRQFSAENRFVSADLLFFAETRDSPAETKWFSAENHGFLAEKNRLLAENHARLAKNRTPSAENRG